MINLKWIVIWTVNHYFSDGFSSDDALLKESKRSILGWTNSSTWKIQSLWIIFRNPWGFPWIFHIFLWLLPSAKLCRSASPNGIGGYHPGPSRKAERRRRAAIAGGQNGAGRTQLAAICRWLFGFDDGISMGIRIGFRLKWKNSRMM